MSHSKKTTKKDSKGDKLAVFLCRCGSNIADTIDIDALRSKYESEGIPLVEVDDHLCSDQGVSDLVEKVKKSKAKRVVIAGCSPLLHRELFSDAAKEAGINPGYLQMANIREQCSWVHYDDPEAATKKAAAIIDTEIAKVRGSNPIPTNSLPIMQRVMIVGGGVAGITSALELADAGIETVIVEKEGFLGGHMAKWDKLFPTFDCSICILGPLMTRLSRHDNIRIMTLAEVTDVIGNVGHYRVTVKQRPRYVDIESCTGCNRCIEVCPVEVADEYNSGLGDRRAMVRPTVDAVPIAPYIDPDTCIGCQSCAGVCEPKSLRFDDAEKTEIIDVGAVILATGFKPFNPTIVEEFGYGRIPDVITSLELERLINPGGPSGGKLVRPSNGKRPRNIVFVSCVGSRSHRFNRPYCSRVCCTAAVKEVIQVKQQLRSYMSAPQMSTKLTSSEEQLERSFRTRLLKKSQLGQRIHFCGVCLSLRLIWLSSWLVWMRNQVMPPSLDCSKPHWMRMDSFLSYIRNWVQAELTPRGCFLLVSLKDQKISQTLLRMQAWPPPR